MWLIGGAAVVVVLLVVGIVVGLLDRPEELRAGTPERAVQDLLKATKDHDYQAIHDSLILDLREECNVDRIARLNVWLERKVRDSRITLEETKVIDGTAIVTIRVTSFSSDGPFGSSERSHRETYSLRNEGGEWRFSQDPWPNFCCRIPPPPPLYRPGT